MCGIAGIFERTGRQVDRRALEAMTSVLAHRGPDGMGFHVDGGLGLGHRRLSIIDLESGAQPLANEDQSVWTAFNGEIYNYREMTAELKALGHRFATESDTEVIVHAYEQYGPDFLQRLNGMFAIALWDARRKRLLLARDRLGIKPLIYSITSERLLFGSEIKALLRFPDIRREADPQALVDFFAFRVVSAPRTAFRGISRLEPGQALVLEAEGEPRLYSYWDYPLTAPAQTLSHHETAESLQALLADATRLQMRSDVPLGAFLSGGVDSTAVVVHMESNRSGYRPRTFTIGYKQDDEAAFDESRYARDVADRLGAQHTEYMLGGYEIEPLLDRLLWFYDEPCATAIPNYFVSQIARREVTVALSGIGGDELFAGYGRYHAAAHVAAPNESQQAFLRRFLLSQALSAPEELPSMFGPALSRKEIEDPLGRILRNAPKGMSNLNAAAYIDLKNYLANDLLPFTDLMSMAHSLEVRVPLLDHRIAEFAASLPDEAKIFRGIQKYVLKRTLSGKVPSEVFTRKKKGFQLPLSVWLEQLRPLVMRTLTRQRVSSHGLVAWEPISYLLGQFYGARKRSWKNTYQIWAYLIFQLWHERFIEALPSAEPPLSSIEVVAA